MIYTKLSNISRYKGILKNLDTAIDFLAKADLNTLALGKTTVDGERVFINRFNYETVPVNIIEGHMDYIDIHIVLSGKEEIGVADVTDLKEIDRKPEEDFIGFEGEFTSRCTLNQGDFALVFPEDAHSPKLCSGAPCAVKKAVVKVLVK